MFQDIGKFQPQNTTLRSSLVSRRTCDPLAKTKIQWLYGMVFQQCYSALESSAGIAQLGERQTEDLKVTCSIHVHRMIFLFCIYVFGPNITETIGLE
ncbi:hypothetical protein GQ457_14G024330 [Hibiscus cannabinus]